MWLFILKAIKIYSWNWWWGISVGKAVRHRALRDATSVRNTVIIKTRRPPSRLLSQIISVWPHSSKGQNPPLVKTCQEGGVRQRKRMRNWGKGQAWMLQLLLWNWTWMSCTDAVVLQLCGLVCHLWQRGSSTGRRVHIHQLCSPGRSSARNLIFNT